MACGSSTTTSTAPSAIERCAVTLRAGTGAVPAAGGGGTVAVTTARECSWSAASEAGWLTIDGPASGQGDGSIEYRAAPNPDPVSRRGTIAANDQRTEITQAAGACLIRLRDSSADFPPTGGDGVVELEASSPLCSWTASADASWIALTSSAEGQGSASVGFRVAPTTGPPRAGTIAVADQVFSVTQSQGCSYAVAPAGVPVPPSGGERDIAVTTAPGCPWTASSHTPWITIVRGASGTGPGTASISVAPTEGPPRTGTLVVAGQTVTVTQSPGCAFEVEPLSHAVPAAGGALTVIVRAAPGCGWSASSAVPWIRITGPSSGSGDGSVALAVAASTGSARTGTVVIAGETVTVTQAPGCTYTIAPEAASVPAAGADGRVEVTTADGCAWTAASGADWITVTSGGSGSGSGRVEYRVAATTGAERSGTIAIAGRTFTVTQGPGCEVALVPQSVVVSASGGSPRFDVRTGAGCEWTAVAGVPWISIRSGASGSGNGTVRLDVAANPGAPRTGTIAIGGEAFTIRQDGACTFAIAPEQRSVAAGGERVLVTVTTGDGCAWTASSSEAWMPVTAGASGSGSGGVEITVAPNTGAARTGTAIIAGQTFTVEQAGGCTYGTAPQERSIDARGGSGMFTVTTSSAACAWTAVSRVAWITIRGEASGSGTGRVDYRVAPNAGPARTGTIAVEDRVFTVTQSGS